MFLNIILLMSILIFENQYNEFDVIQLNQGNYGYRILEMNNICIQDLLHLNKTTL